MNSMEAAIKNYVMKCVVCDVGDGCITEFLLQPPVICGRPYGRLAVHPEHHRSYVDCEHQSDSTRRLHIDSILECYLLGFIQQHQELFNHEMEMVSSP